MPRMLDRKHWLSLLALIAALVVSAPSSAQAAKKVRGSERLEEMSLERWAMLREAERYQLKIAEKLYVDKNYTAAAAEYEKFISLYETSEGAPYAQLKWALCQANLKKLNTAIKDGYQTVIDYWPDSPEAVASALLIARTYRTIGEIAPAKEAYAKVVSEYPDEMVAILARLELAEIARIERDEDRRLALLKDLVFNAPRKGDVARSIVEASRTLASLHFYRGDFAAGKAALATSYQEPGLSNFAAEYVSAVLKNQLGDSATKDQALKVADAAIKHFQSLLPADVAANKPLVRQLHYLIVSVQTAAQRADEAGKTFEQLLKLLPKDDEVITRYGDWLAQRGRFAEARSTYRELSDPIAVEALIAQSFRSEKKPLEAVPIYEALIAKDPERAAGWQWHLAESYRDGGKYREAIAAYRESSVVPEKYERIADSQRRLKQYDEAILTYRELMANSKNREAWALLQIGLTEEQAGKKESAIKTLQKVCKTYPRSGEASQAHAHLQNQYNISVTLGGAKAE